MVSMSKDSEAVVHTKYFTDWSNSSPAEQRPIFSFTNLNFSSTADHVGRTTGAQGASNLVWIAARRCSSASTSMVPKMSMLRSSNEEDMLFEV